MANIYKKLKKNGTEVYHITVCNGYDKNGKKIKKTTTYTPDQTLTPKQREKAANKFAMEFEEKVHNGICMDGEKITFEMFTDKWLAFMKDNLAYSTYVGYVQLLEQRIVPYFRTYKMTKITTPIVEDFYKTLVDEYSYATIKKCDNILSGMFKTAIRWQMIQFNPCTNAMIPKTARKSDDKLKYFTPEQSLMFLRSLDKPYETLYKGHYRTDDTGKRYYVDDYTETRDVSTQYKVFYYISLFCGLRKGETLALQWSDIDFEQRIIHVSKSVTKLEDGVAYKDPKTASSNRTVPMPDEVMALLKKYKSEYLQLRLMMGDAWQGENNIFIQSDGKLMGRSTPYQFFKRHLNRYNEWVKNSGEEAKKQGYEELPIIPLHGLRHSCATLLNYLGTNIVDIAKLLGHAQTSTTMNTYAHSFDSQNYVICDKMNEFMRNNGRKQA